MKTSIDGPADATVDVHYPEQVIRDLVRRWSSCRDSFLGPRTHSLPNQTSCSSTLSSATSTARSKSIELVSQARGGAAAPDAADDDGDELPKGAFTKHRPLLSLQTAAGEGVAYRSRQGFAQRVLSTDNLG